MRILPREEKFFELLNNQTRLINEAAKVLLDGVQAGNSRMRELESQYRTATDDKKQLIKHTQETIRDYVKMMEVHEKEHTTFKA